MVIVLQPRPVVVLQPHHHGDEEDGELAQDVGQQDHDVEPAQLGRRDGVEQRGGQRDAAHEGADAGRRRALRLIVYIYIGRYRGLSGSGPGQRTICTCIII